MLLGLTGARGSGKDTAFRLIKQQFPEAEQLSFASQLKLAVATLLLISPDLVEALKADEEFKWVPQKQGGTPKDFPPLNMRTLLQRMGTEVGRELWGPDFWVDQTLPRDLTHQNRILVVTDLRFPNESERIRLLSGATCQIWRPDLRHQDGHASEAGLPQELIDYRITNFPGHPTHMGPPLKDIVEAELRKDRAHGVVKKLASGNR